MSLLFLESLQAEAKRTRHADISEKSNTLMEKLKEISPEARNSLIEAVRSNKDPRLAVGEEINNISPEVFDLLNELAPFISNPNSLFNSALNVANLSPEEMQRLAAAIQGSEEPSIYDLASNVANLSPEEMQRLAAAIQEGGSLDDSKKHPKAR